MRFCLPRTRQRIRAVAATLATALCAAGSVAAPGQTVAGVTKLPSGDIARAFRDGAAGPARDLWTGRAWRMIVVRRAEPGEVEVHATEDDLFILRSGAALVTVGGRVEGDRETAPNERRGGRIVGGSPVTLGAGDQLLIAAGVPHQVSPSGGHVEYLVLKAAGGRRAR